MMAAYIENGERFTVDCHGALEELPDRETLESIKSELEIGVLVVGSKYYSLDLEMGEIGSRPIGYRVRNYRKIRRIRDEMSSVGMQVSVMSSKLDCCEQKIGFLDKDLPDIVAEDCLSYTSVGLLPV